MKRPIPTLHKVLRLSHVPIVEGGTQHYQSTFQTPKNANKKLFPFLRYPNVPVCMKTPKITFEERQLNIQSKVFSF